MKKITKLALLASLVVTSYAPSGLSSSRNPASTPKCPLSQQVSAQVKDLVCPNDLNRIAEFVPIETGVCYLDNYNNNLGNGNIEGTLADSIYKSLIEHGASPYSTPNNTYEIRNDFFYCERHLDGDGTTI